MGGISKRTGVVSYILYAEFTILTEIWIQEVGMAKEISNHIEENISYFHKTLSVDRNFDIIYRV